MECLLFSLLEQRATLHTVLAMSTSMNYSLIDKYKWLAKNAVWTNCTRPQEAQYYALMQRQYRLLADVSSTEQSL